MESYFDRCLIGPPFREHEEKKYEFQRLLSFERWPKDSPIFPLKLSGAGFYHTGSSDEVACYKCGVTKSNWQQGEDPYIIHRQLQPECDFLCDTCNDNIPFTLELDERRSSIIERLDSIGEDRCAINLNSDSDVAESPTLDAHTVGIPQSKSEPCLNKGKDEPVKDCARGYKPIVDHTKGNKSVVGCSNSATTSSIQTYTKAETEETSNQFALVPCNQKDKKDNLAEARGNSVKNDLNENGKARANGVDVPGNVTSAAESLNSSSQSAGASCPTAAPSSLPSVPFRNSEPDKNGACASAPNSTTGVPKCKSEGYLNKDLSAATGAATSSIRTKEYAGRKVNVTDSEAVTTNTSKVVPGPDSRKFNEPSIEIGKGSSKKESRSKEKTPNSSKPMQSSRSGNPEQRNMERNRARDIPPPSGAEIGPMRFERNRLETFNNWPKTACVPPAELSRCGFYFTGSADRVQCVFCKGILRNWEEGDRPHIEHRKHFPNCPLVLGLSSIGNVPLPLDQQSQSSGTRSGNGSQTRTENSPQNPRNVVESLTNLEGLGIITDRPKHPRYAIESQRLASFQGWPAYKHQTPQQLAEAGFWFAGFNDNVKCFYCDGGLRNWEPTDQPWVEHAHWFPQCPFVKQVKGQEFIKAVVREKGSVDVPILSQVPRPRPENVARRPHAIEEREVRARMDRAYVKVVEEMGVSRELIMKTIRERLRTTGDDFPSSTALLEAAFAMQPTSQEEESSTANEENSPATNQIDPVATTTTDIDHVTGPALDVPYNEAGSKTGMEKLKSEDNSQSEDEDLRKENLELKEQRLCKICMVADANVVFLPCGHLVSCAGCAPALQTCPICREMIKGTVRTYLA